MTRYRRIEINAFRRRFTVVSGEWPRDSLDLPPIQTTDWVSLNDSDADSLVEPDSPEGQLILVEAVRSLEQRLSPEARATIWAGRDTLPNDSKRNGFYRKLQFFYQFVWQKAHRVARNEDMK